MLHTIGQGAVLTAIANAGFTNTYDDYHIASFEKTDASGNHLRVDVAWELLDPDKPNPYDHARAVLVPADDGYHFWLYPAESEMAKSMKAQRLDKLLHSLPPLLQEFATQLKEARATLQESWARETFTNHAQFTRVDCVQRVNGTVVTAVHAGATFTASATQPPTCSAQEEPACVEPEPLPTWVYFFPTIVAVSVIAAVALLMALMV